ncbi:glutamine--fructose-6-phosphate transaminase (isomerizing) [Candidatus Thorarchaeota archaeon]|nr:glutamine--fructose-6-phosphate transaminase (isomerizing) [Candidatus Thorarchaeota archaeon]TFG99838.1 MAG: glutamine--fructose-6-phosphate transaminase (isomerizing) [Candidatus Thorarchaeota archaeon]
MCGIIGVVQKRGDVAPFIHQALKRLEYRGYDSVGVTTIEKQKLYIKKDKGKVEEVHRKLDLDEMPGSIGIGHTRWATHGAPSMLNSHPHFDCNDEIAVVHNGVIDNFMELREELSVKGHKLKSETDTEIIPHLLEDYMKEGMDLVDAVKEVTKRIEGTYAIVVMSVKEEDKIVCTRDGNPLVIGRKRDVSYVSSDIPAFLPMTSDMILLLDGEIACLTSDGVRIENLSDGSEIKRDSVEISWTADQAQKSGYPHFMLKEIHEQPEAIRNTLKLKDDVIKRAAEIIHSSDRIFMLAMGTSGHSALAGRHMFASIAGVLPAFELASDFSDTVYGALTDRDCIIAITQSGETTDTITAVKYAKEMGVKIIAITNVVGSSITRLADHTILTQAGPEIGVAATKTFMVQLTSLALIALALGELTGFTDSDSIENKRECLKKIPEIVSDTISRNEELARRLAGELYEKTSLLFLGRGVSIATVEEAALKLKEIAYNHAEAYSAGESKHGPIALVEDDFPVIFVVPNDQTRSRMIGNIMEMKARGASVVSVILKDDSELERLSKFVFTIPEDIEPEFSTMVFIVPLQLFSYYMALKKGYDPDMPRNLAKSVTVL